VASLTLTVAQKCLEGGAQESRSENGLNLGVQESRSAVATMAEALITVEISPATASGLMLPALAGEATCFVEINVDGKVVVHQSELVPLSLPRWNNTYQLAVPINSTIGFSVFAVMETRRCLCLGTSGLLAFEISPNWAFYELPLGKSGSSLSIQARRSPGQAEEFRTPAEEATSLGVQRSGSEVQESRSEEAERQGPLNTFQESSQTSPGSSEAVQHTSGVKAMTVQGAGQPDSVVPTPPSSALMNVDVFQVNPWAAMQEMERDPRTAKYGGITVGADPRTDLTYLGAGWNEKDWLYGYFGPVPINESLMGLITECEKQLGAYCAQHPLDLHTSVASCLNALLKMLSKDQQAPYLPMLAHALQCRLLLEPHAAAKYLMPPESAVVCSQTYHTWSYLDHGVAGLKSFLQARGFWSSGVKESRSLPVDAMVSNKALLDRWFPARAYGPDMWECPG
jgi:hypothetical protein